MKEPLVSICCIAYNHEAFIREAIESFLMQKRDFPIEIIVHDDASRDGTTEIIKEYEEKFPSLIKPIYQEENQHRQGNIPLWDYFVFPRVSGEYIALCDADDYWTDPLKLQKQVNFMKSNKDCSLCFHATKMVYSNNGKDTKIAHQLNNGESTVFDGTDLLSGQINGWTSSLFFRSDIAKNLPAWYKSIRYGDAALKMISAARGDIGYIGGEPMSVYRRGVKGAWSQDEGKSQEWEEQRLKNHLQLIRYFNDYTDHQFEKELRIKWSKHVMIFLLSVQPYCTKLESAKLIAKYSKLFSIKPKSYIWVLVRFAFGEKVYDFLRGSRRRIRS